MLHNLTPSPFCYPFKMCFYFICNRSVVTANQRNSCTQRHDDTLITSWWYDNYFTQTRISRASHDDVNVSPPKARVRSRDCSMFCIEKCKHLAPNVRFHLSCENGKCKYWLLMGYICQQWFWIAIMTLESKVNGKYTLSCLMAHNQNHYVIFIKSVHI